MTEAAADIGTQIERRGWRQCAILPVPLAAIAANARPAWLQTYATAFNADVDWLIVLTHDCDLVNASLEKEPAVELLRAVCLASPPNPELVWGKNPRSLHCTGMTRTTQTTLKIMAQDRWTVPRDLLTRSACDPDRTLPGKVAKAIINWQAKRYFRAAFPGAFDARWHGEQIDSARPDKRRDATKFLRAWTALIGRHSAAIKTLYMQLNTMAELAVDLPYSLRLLVIIEPHAARSSSWTTIRAELDRDISAFWRQFPGVTLREVDIRVPDDISLGEMEGWHRFDADWLSASDDSGAPPIPDSALMGA